MTDNPNQPDDVVPPVPPADDVPTVPVPAVEPPVAAEAPVVVAPVAPGAAQAPAAPASPVLAAPAAATPAMAVPAPRGHRRARRVATVVGILGLIGCVLLAVGILFGRSWASDQVGGIFADVDQTVAQGGTIADDATARTQQRSAQLDLVISTASGLDVGSRVPPALSSLVTTFTDAYDSVRARYTDVRDQVGASIRTLNRLASIVPGVDVPSGPQTVLTQLDQRLQAVDASITALRGSGSAADSTVKAVVDAATALKATVDRVTEVTTQVKTASDDIRQRLDDAHAKLDLYLWLGAGGFLLLVLYVALLNVLVIWLSRG